MGAAPLVKVTRPNKGIRPCVTVSDCPSGSDAVSVIVAASSSRTVMDCAVAVGGRLGAPPPPEPSPPPPHAPSTPRAPAASEIRYLRTAVTPLPCRGSAVWLSRCIFSEHT